MANESKEFIKNIILHGSPEDKRILYEFSFSTPRRLIAKKFKYFSRGEYPRYFKQKSSPVHDLFIEDMISSYFGNNHVQAGYRGSAKTALKKLFDVFVLLNDRDNYRKFIKIITKDSKNSKQIVTDVYNLMLEVIYLYGNPFEREANVKREETKSSFTMKNGRKYMAGTVGQTQRGHIQDAYRPDWIWFEDIEDRESISSLVVTQGIIDQCGEAIDGLSIDGSYYVTCNYISDQGVVQTFMNKTSVQTRITPLLTDHLDDTSVTWAIFTPEIVQQKRSESEDWYGEWLCDPKRSENKFFDVEKIEADIKKCKSPTRISGDVWYWSSYKAHHRYGQGSDHAEGIGLDANALAGFDFTSGEQIYSAANNQIAPDIAAHDYARVGAEFGNCIFAPENNNKCGGIVVATLKSIPYPNIYRMVIETGVKSKVSFKLGWETNSKTRYQMFYEFRKDYNDGLAKINDERILKEMKAFTNNDLTQQSTGVVTRHFDLLTATVIAWQMRKHADSSQDSEMEAYADNYAKYLESLKG